jgi:hypothetical protein
VRTRRGSTVLASVMGSLLVACGALIGAEWDATLRGAALDGAAGGDDADTADAGENLDGSVALDAADAGDAGDADAAPKICGGDSKWCQCIANKPKTDGGVACSESSVGGAPESAFCCASKNWPIAGTCTCSRFKCNRTSPDFCMCGPYGDAGSTSSCSGALCCYSPLLAYCSCYDTGITSCPAVSADEVPVLACAVPQIKCGTDEQRVTDCAP